MSRRDLAHVLTALWNLSGAAPDIAVAVADIDKAIGRGHGDMRTPLNLQSLAEQGLVVAAAAAGRSRRRASSGSCRIASCRTAERARRRGGTWRLVR
jgi:hypothetical protein